MLKHTLLTIAMIAGAMLAATGPAAAQAVDQAAARAAAQDMISRVWADPAFKADAWEKGPLVRHYKTGLVCRFNADARNSVDVYEGEKFTMVGCTVGTGDTIVYSYGNPPTGDVEQIAIGAEQALKRAYANVAPYAGPAGPPATAGGPPTLVSRFTGERNGQRWYIRLTSADMGRWSYVQRAVGPVESAAQTDRLAVASLADQARDAGFTLQASAAP